MKFKEIMASTLLSATAMTLAAPAGASQVLYDGSGFVTGQQSFVQSFDLSGPGTLTVTLSNLAFPVSLASLNVLVGTSSGLLGPEMGTGTQSFQVQGGELFAQWFGTAQGALDVGVYGINIQFQPTGGIAPVPLPASLALFASGLGLLAWQRRHRLVPKLLPSASA